jgi:hypothetical protein
MDVINCDVRTVTCVGNGTGTINIANSKIGNLNARGEYCSVVNCDFTADTEINAITIANLGKNDTLNNCVLNVINTRFYGYAATVENETSIYKRKAFTNCTFENITQFLESIVAVTSKYGMANCTFINVAAYADNGSTPFTAVQCFYQGTSPVLPPLYT